MAALAGLLLLSLKPTRIAAEINRLNGINDPSKSAEIQFERFNIDSSPNKNYLFAFLLP